MNEVTQEYKAKRFSGIARRLFVVLVPLFLLLVGVIVILATFFLKDDVGAVKFFPKETLVYTTIRADFDSNSLIDLEDLISNLEDKKQTDQGLSPFARFAQFDYQGEIKDIIGDKISLGVVNLHKDSEPNGIMLAIPLENKVKALNLISRAFQGEKEEEKNIHEVRLKQYPEVSFYYFIEDNNLIVSNNASVIKTAIECYSGIRDSLPNNPDFEYISKKGFDNDLFVYFNNIYLSEYFDVSSSIQEKFGWLFNYSLLNRVKGGGIWVHQEEDSIQIKSFVYMDDNYSEEAVKNITDSTLDLINEIPEDAIFFMLQGDLEYNLKKLFEGNNNNSISEQQNIILSYFENNIQNNLSDLFNNESALLVLEENKAFYPGLILNIKDLASAKNQMLEMEKEVQVLANISLSSKISNFLLPDGTKASEVVKDDFRFKSGEINSIETRELDAFKNLGLFYAFDRGKLFITSNKTGLEKTLDGDKKTFTKNKSDNFLEKSKSNDKCISVGYLNGGIFLATLLDLFDQETALIKNNNQSFLFNLFKTKNINQDLFYRVNYLQDGFETEALMKR